MAAQDRQGLLHQGPQDLLAFAFRQVLADRLPDDVLGRRQRHAVLALGPDHEIPVRHAGIELHDFGAQLLVHVVDQLLCLERVDLPGAVVLHHSMGPQLLHVIAAGVRPQGHQVAPVGNVVGIQRDAEAGRFQRRKARVVFLRVVAQNRQLRHVAARIEAVRRRLHQPEFPIPGQEIQVGGLGRLERRAPSEFRQGMVAHPIPQQDHIFHANQVRPPLRNRQ